MILTAYFDLAFTLARQEGDLGSLKYAIARLNSVDVADENWPILENILGQCVLVDPACLPQVCEQIVHYKSLDYDVNVELWDELLNRIVGERLPLGQASEAVWAMWIMKLLEISLAGPSEAAVNECEDSAAGLMGLGLASVGLGDFATLQGLRTFAEPDELFGRQWLLCYEGVKQGWIRPASGRPVTDSQFRFLLAKDVSFFNIEAALPAPRRKGPPVGGGSGGEYPF